MAQLGHHDVAAGLVPKDDPFLGVYALPTSHGMFVPWIPTTPPYAAATKLKRFAATGTPVTIKA